MAQPMTILLAYPGLDAEKATARVQAVAPDATVLVCPYGTTHDVRTLRDEDPWSSGIEEVMPAFTPEQRAAFARADVLLTLDPPLSLGEVAPRLRWVQGVGAGYSRYRSAGLLEAGIRFSNAVGASADGIAEFVLARLLEHWKRLPEIAQRQRDHDWGFTFGRRVAGKRVTVVGLGGIGSHVARLCRALDMVVTGVARTGGDDPRVDVRFGADRLLEAVAEADAVVLCATDAPDNENLFDDAVFGAMPAGAFFVNVSRGRLVDDTALIAALDSGHLSAAAVDTLRVEPVPADSDWWDARNLRLSPHSASTQEGYVDRVLDLFCANLQRFLEGKPLLNEVDLAS